MDRGSEVPDSAFSPSSARAFICSFGNNAPIFDCCHQTMGQGLEAATSCVGGALKFACFSYYSCLNVMTVCVMFISFAADSCINIPLEFVSCEICGLIDYFFQILTIIEVDGPICFLTRKCSIYVGGFVMHETYRLQFLRF